MLNPVPSEQPHTGSAIRGAGVVIAMAALLALVSYFISVNEYVSVFGSEMAGAYDCDGPAVVLTFAVAGIVLGLLGILLSGRALRRSRTPAVRIALGVAMIVVVVATARIAPTIGEVKRNAAPDSPCR
jgi:glucan phosphoethanolaminetransferase (alkaline phosphatase superfamily)